MFVIRKQAWLLLALLALLGEIFPSDSVNQRQILTWHLGSMEASHWPQQHVAVRAWVTQGLAGIRQASIG